MKTKLLTTAIAFILGMGIQQNAHADLKDGLVAHWSFDDCRATDNSGNGHDGTLNGNPQCVDGVKGKAFSFDGSNDWLDGSINSDAFAGNWTIATWFYHKGNETPTVTWGGIFSNNNNEVSNAPVMSFRGGDDNNTGIADSNYFGIDGAGITAKGTFIDLGSHLNKWIFAVITYQNGIPTVYAYKDGQLIKNSQALPYVLQRGDKFYIARHYGGPNTVQLYKGSIDDLRIYNRALTEAEVMELYNGGGVEEVVKVPEVLKVEPTEAIKNKYTVFTVTGSNLTADNIEFNLDGCVNANTENERTQSTDTKRLFRCMLPTTGEIRGRIYSASTGKLLNTFGVQMRNPPAVTSLKTTDSFPLNGVMTPDWVKLKTDKATWKGEVSGDAIDDKTAYEGRFSFGSAKIGANQTAAIETTINVTQAGQLSFARRVSSNPEHGVLNFEISGKQKNGAWKTLITEKSSGDVAWEMKNYALTVGQFKLRWTYAKDGAEAKGEDKAWIDAVSYPSSVKVAAKTCEGITAGTVKLMTIKNPTCDQLQAYKVWSTLIRPAKLAENDHWKADLDTVEGRNQLWEKWVKIISSVVAVVQVNYSLDTGDAVGGVTSALSKSLDFLCNGVFDDPVNQSLCGVGKDFVVNILDGYFQKLATGQAATYGWGAAPDIIEKAITIGYNLRDAWDADEIALTLNNTNLADDVLDEYYKGGSNDAALKVMAKKYGAKNTALSTLIDSMANQKGYYNGWADSLTWSFYGNEYSNETVVNNIESVKNLNRLTIKNFLNK